jgi:RND superfamily putative drug exporter
MLVRWGYLLVRARWSVLALTVVLVGFGATWGAGVFGVLSGGGFDDPSSPSAKVRHQLIGALGPQDTDILVLCTPALTGPSTTPPSRQRSPAHYIL